MFSNIIGIIKYMNNIKTNNLFVYCFSIKNLENIKYTIKIL